MLAKRYSVPANQVLVLADPSLARLREAIPKFLDSVVAGQLLAFVREKVRNGEEVPLETLGLFAGRVAKVKASGKRRK